MQPSLDGRVFAQLERPTAGEVGPGTRFSYREDGGQVWATYAGGDIARGFLVGTRDGDTLDFRYVHLNTAGKTSSGHCASRIVGLPDGRLRLEETWQWESRPGAGTSTVEEPPPDA